MSCGPTRFNWSLANWGYSARIPQIIKNYRDKSCEGKSSPPTPTPTTSRRVWGSDSALGLALLFFLLSLTGNMAYGLSLLSYSQDSDYLLTALPWLLGSLGTVVEDSIIFVQFRIYSKNGASQDVSSS